MSLTTKNCKLFIAKNAKKKNVPLEDWKRISKIKSENGWIRVFSHKDGYEIEILESFESSRLKWLSTKTNVTNIELKKYSFNDLPNSVKLFVNTLRSLMGQKILEEKVFDKKYIEMWKKAIKERKSKNSERLPDIFMHDIEPADDIWNLLHDSADDLNAWNDDNVLKYVGNYFWFAFSNDPRDENEQPEIYITPKGFWDDGRIPIIFSDKIKNTIVKDLTEVMESTVEFNSEKNDPIDKLRDAYQLMNQLGIVFSFELQENQINSSCASVDFCDSKWINENLEKTKKMKNKM